MVLMEFKVLTGNGFLKEDEKDFKIIWIPTKISKHQTCLLLLLSDILPSDERMKIAIKQSRIVDLTVRFRNQIKELTVEEINLVHALNGNTLNNDELTKGQVKDTKS